MIHELKTWTDVFEAVLNGIKAFEYRYCGDREFNVGDKLLLREYLPQENDYSGREIIVTVPYIIFGGQFGIPKDYCIMSIFKEE